MLHTETWQQERRELGVGKVSNHIEQSVWRFVSLSKRQNSFVIQLVQCLFPKTVGAHFSPLRSIKYNFCICFEGCLIELQDGPGQSQQWRTRTVLKWRGVTGDAEHDNHGQLLRRRDLFKHPSALEELAATLHAFCLAAPSLAPLFILELSNIPPGCAPPSWIVPNKYYQVLPGFSVSMLLPNSMSHSLDLLIPGNNTMHELTTTRCTLLQEPAACQAAWQLVKKASAFTHCSSWCRSGCVQTAIKLFIVVELSATSGTGSASRYLYKL